MRLEYRITFDDGRVVDVRTKPKHLLAFERDGRKLDATVECAYRLAYAALRAGDGFPDFDAWLDTVDDVEAIGDTPIQPGTEPVPTTASSPD